MNGANINHTSLHEVAKYQFIFAFKQSSVAAPLYTPRRDNTEARKS